jgi:hypothetical protein
VVTGSKLLDDAGSAALAPRERAVSPLANEQHGRLGVTSPLATVKPERRWVHIANPGLGQPKEIP